MGSTGAGESLGIVSIATEAQEQRSDAQGVGRALLCGARGRVIVGAAPFDHTPQFGRERNSLV